jgi:hypothetical protein
MPGNVWNPAAPSILGFEWLVDTYGTTGVPYAQRIRSTGAETINRLDSLAGPTVSDSSRLFAEIITAGNEVPSGSVQVAKYEPNSDVLVTNWTSSGLTTTNLYTFIDEGVDTYNVADWITAPGSLANSYKMSFGSAGFSSSARVLNVTFRMRAAVQSAGGGIVEVSFMQRASGTRWKPFGWQASCSAIYSASQLFEIDLGEVNPATGLPWTPVDIQGFDNGTSVNCMELEAASGNPANVIVIACELQVTYQTVENRVACAVRKKSDTVNRFPAFCALPTAGATWAKPASGDFTVMYRQPHDTFGPVSPQQFTLQWLASATQDCVVPGVVSAYPSVDMYGQITAVDFTGATNSRTNAVLLWNSGPAISNDSLPYALATDTAHGPYIDAFTTIQQTFTGGTGSYSFIKLILDPQAATAALLVKIKRVSDNAQFGSTITIQANDVALDTPTAGNWRVWTDTFLTPATLVAGTRYYVELSTADISPFGTGWHTVLSGDSGLAGGPATFQGTTDFAIVAGVSKTDFDMPFKLIIPPAAPTGLLAAITQTTNHINAPMQGCVPGTISAAVVGWTGTALGGGFGAYRLQRGVASEGIWADIAVINEESTHTFTDYELVRTVEQQYRLRVERSDGVTSAWSAPSSSVVAPVTGCEMLFVSNVDPLLNCAYDYEPGLEYTFVAPQRDEIVEIYGSNFAVAFMEPEDAGITIAARLVVNFGVVPNVRDVSIFDPIRVISRAPLPYVCVMDYVGNQFFAHVQLMKGEWDAPNAHSYHGDIQITQVSGIPSPAVI